MHGREQDEAAPGHAADAGADLVGAKGPVLAVALAGGLRNRLMLPATSDPASHCQGPKASPRRSPEGWRAPDARGDPSVGRRPIARQAPRPQQQGSGPCRTADLSKCLFVEGVAGNSPFYSHGCKLPHLVADMGGCKTRFAGSLAESYTSGHSSQL